MCCACVSLFLLLHCFVCVTRAGEQVRWVVLTGKTVRCVAEGSKWVRVDMLRWFVLLLICLCVALAGKHGR